MDKVHSGPVGASIPTERVEGEVANRLSWQALALLADLSEQKRSDAGLDRYERSAMRALLNRGLVTSERYANGRFWMLTAPGHDAASAIANA